MFAKYWAGAVVLLLASGSAMAATPLMPKGDGEIIEALPVVTRHRPSGLAPVNPKADPMQALATARQQIQMARQTGDTRYWGRAQSALSAWWGSADAPADVAVMQATVQQGRHEFDASREVLQRTLERTPGHAQAWLNLAALERLVARYPQALSACDAVARAGQKTYAEACRMETLSLQGQNVVASQGLQALIAQAADKGQRGWLYSLLAESQERAGQDGPAAQSYQRSLQAEPDLYTSIAYADLLLRLRKNRDAVAALVALPDTDAVVLRRGAAWKRLGDARWREALGQLKTRKLELERRGDDPGLHGRELALTALWLEDDATGALLIARSNLRLQKEPIDWWVAVQSARLARDKVALSELEKSLNQAGLRDVRLQTPAG